MTEAETVKWAEERRCTLRKVMDDISRAVGAEDYMDDVSDLDAIMRKHGLQIVTINPLDGTRLWDKS